MMKNITVKLAFVLGFLIMISCKETPKPGTISGNYTGKNLKVQNPTNPSGIGFCVSEVIVNGKTTSDDITSESFEIDLKGLGLKEGDDVKVELKFSEGCTPKFLNPEVLN